MYIDFWKILVYDKVDIFCNNGGNKMKNQLWKRVLSTVLLVCMLVGIFPAGVSATEEAVDSKAGGSTLSQPLEPKLMG